MGMGMDRATSRGDRPLAVLLLCELEKANGHVQQQQITLNSALRAFVRPLQRGSDTSSSGALDWINTKCI
jgi:hypothetical protein